MFNNWQLGSSAVRKWKVESGKLKVSNALRANVSKFGFSLVELMISLIVISVVTAAFAPVVTKKLKTSDQSIGTATAVSITSNSICNAISAGCIECENDKCLAVSEGYFLNETTGKSQHCNTTITGCAQCADSSTCTKSEDGYYFDGVNPVKCPDSCSTCTSGSVCTGCKSAYWLNSSSCTACSVQNAACQTCSNGSTCTRCADNYMLSNGKCVKCPNHCKTCTSASVCTMCDNGYFKTVNNVCFKYTCDSTLCYLTKNDDKVLSMYRYSLGNGGFDITSAMGINVCWGGKSCSFPSTTPLCWRSNIPIYSTGSLATCSVPTNSTSFSRCQRTVCNYYAAKKAEAALKSQGWRIPNTTDDYQAVKHISSFIAGGGLSDPFCLYLDHTGIVQGCGSSFVCINSPDAAYNFCEVSPIWARYGTDGSYLIRGEGRNNFMDTYGTMPSFMWSVVLVKN